MRFIIFRTEASQGHRYDTFDLELSPGMTVMSALFKIRETYDESLAFRYSCRGAVCGTCAMLINRVPRLACRTQVETLVRGNEIPHLDSYLPVGWNDMVWDSAAEVLIEPLPYMPVIRDLVVDMDHFFACYRKTNPVLAPAEPMPEREQPMSQEEVEALEIYTACILCGACYAACPVNEKNPEYWGPAALAKLFRFHIDPRDRGGVSRLTIADVPEGWWACEFHGNCHRVCPKDVPPNVAIGKAERELLDMEIRKKSQLQSEI